MYAVQLLEHRLLDAGQHLTLVAPASPSVSPDHSHPGRDELRLPSLQIPGVKLRMSLGKGFDEALAQIERGSPDLVHVHGLGPVGLLGMWAAERIGCPSVVTWHTDFAAYADHFGALTPLLAIGARRLLPRTPEGLRQLDRVPRRPSRQLLTGLASDMLAAATIVTTPSAKTARRVRELAPTATVRPVPNGCDPLPEAPALGPRRGTRLLYVGWIAAEKGIPDLLTAFRDAAASRPGVELVLVGSVNTADRGLVRSLKKAQHAGWLTLAGEVPREDLDAWYRSADAFVFPSMTDTQALVLHEAAHVGLPLIVADPGLDLVAVDGVNAVMTGEGSGHLAEGIARMLHLVSDPQWVATASERGRQLAARYTEAGQAAAMLAIYRELAPSPAAHSTTRNTP